MIMAPLILLAIVLPVGITTHGHGSRHRHAVQVTSWSEPLPSWQPSLFPQFHKIKPQTPQQQYMAADPVHAFQSQHLAREAHKARAEYLLVVKARRQRAAEKKAAERAAAHVQLTDKTFRAAHAAHAVRGMTVPVPSGSPQQIAQGMLGSYGWSSSQMGCLIPLWNTESGWNYQADNPGSGAYGIPQALPGDKMASAGSDWMTNPATQIKWGLGYIQSTYGSPCGAEDHEQADGWY